VAPGSNRLLTIGAAAGSLVLLAAVVFMLWPSDPMEQASTGREQSDGETVGWVSKVEGNRIHVNAGPFGGGVVPLEVTKHAVLAGGVICGWRVPSGTAGKQLVIVVTVHSEGKTASRTFRAVIR